MTNDLTTSSVARSNVLNNRYALGKLETHLALGSLRIDGELMFFKAHVAELLDIDERTIDRYLASHETELKQSGYQILKGKPLKNMKLAQVDDIHVVDLIGVKTPSLGVFPFRAVLNLAMLVTESERAKAIRSRMLDIILFINGLPLVLLGLKTLLTRLPTSGRPATRAKPTRPRSPMCSSTTRCWSYRTVRKHAWVPCRPMPSPACNGAPSMA